MGLVRLCPRTVRRVLLVLVLVAPPAAAQTPGDLSGLDEVVAAAMAEWHLPGLAVGIIRDGRVVLARGYGHRDVEGRLPVTPRTLFAIGSNSKSFTVVLMGMLVDEGRLDWTRPVRTWLPDFELKDPYATREMTPQDLVSHLSGLPRHDLLWYGRSWSRDEIYRRLKYLEPSTTFRNVWQYQNLMFLTAGLLTERITGQSWDEQIRTRIFAPLGMVRANTSVRDLPSSDDFSWAYDYRDGKVVRIPFRNIDHVGAAGSINASVEDMLKYVQFRIDHGMAGGRQLLSARQDSLMQRPRAVVPGGWAVSGSVDAGVGPDTYGLGLAITGYRGHKLVIHGGGIDGFISQMAWLPQERIGFIVLSNSTNSGGGGNPVPNALTYHLVDRMLGLPRVDWFGRVRAQSARADSLQKARRAQDLKDRVAGTRPSRELEAYAGRYEHPAYGVIEIRRTAAGLEAELDGDVAALAHVHFDQFEVPPGQPGSRLSGRFGFGLDAKGAVTTVSAPLEPAVGAITFTRKAGE